MSTTKPKLNVVVTEAPKEEDKGATYWVDPSGVKHKGELYVRMTRFLERIDRRQKTHYSRREVVELLRTMRDTILQ